MLTRVMTRGIRGLNAKADGGVEPVALQRHTIARHQADILTAVGVLGTLSSQPSPRERWAPLLEVSPLPRKVPLPPSS